VAPTTFEVKNPRVPGKKEKEGHTTGKNTAAQNVDMQFIKYELWWDS